MASAVASAVPPPPRTCTKWLSMKPTLTGGSSGRDGIRSGRIPTSNDSSATRAARLAERTEVNVAPASTNVPPAVASDEIVAQLLTRPQYGGVAESASVGAAQVSERREWDLNPRWASPRRFSRPVHSSALSSLQ